MLIIAKYLVAFQEYEYILERDYEYSSIISCYKFILGILRLIGSGSGSGQHMVLSHPRAVTVVN